MSVYENEVILLDKKDLKNLLYTGSETSRWVSEVAKDYITHNSRVSLKRAVVLWNWEGLTGDVINHFWCVFRCDTVGTSLGQLVATVTGEESPSVCI